MVNNTVDNRAIDTVEWIVLSKAPVLGLVKTRLIPALGQQGACDVYLQLLVRLENTLKTLVVNNKTQVALWIAGDAEHDAFKSWSSFATLYQQPEAGPDLRVKEIDLGKRMAVAVESSLARGCIPVLIGVDVPDLTEKYLTNCLEQLRLHDVVISPAEDGGYGLFGMKHFYSEVFKEKTWGTDAVFQQTQLDLKALEIKTAYLPKVWDVDEIEDVERFLA